MSSIKSVFKLRPWTSDDAESLTWHANNPKIAGMLRDVFLYPYTIEAANTWLNEILPLENGLFYAIEINGKAAGGIGVNYKTDVYRLNGEIGYWLGEAYWGGGIMTQAICLIVEEVFKETEIIRIYAEVFESNPASARVLEKCGFNLEGEHKNCIIKNGIIMGTQTWAIYKNLS